MSDDDRLPEAPHDEIALDSRNLRGIAHPVRVRLLGLLRFDGSSTATRLAQRLGLNSGATSYHLRQLERHGFIVEDESQGRGRERWWRAAHRMTRYEDVTGDVDAETSELAESYLRSVVAANADLAQRAIDEGPSLPDEWRRASTFNDVEIRVSPGEREQLIQELLAVVARYDRREDEGDAPVHRAPVMVQLYAFPRPGALTSEGES